MKVQLRWGLVAIITTLISGIAFTIYISTTYLFVREKAFKSPLIIETAKKRGVDINECAATANDIMTLRQNMISIAKSISKAQLHARGLKTTHFLKKAFADMQESLDLLSINPDDLTLYPQNGLRSVCPEEYKGTLHGYPFFEKGFERVSCEHSQPIETILTVVITFSSDDIDIYDVLKEILHTYGLIKILVGLRNRQKSVMSKGNLSENVSITYFTKNESSGKIQNVLINKVTTEYILIARDLIYFDEDVRLERLIQEIEYLNIAVAAGASRDQNGRWDRGCFQKAFRNFTFILEDGYDFSIHECLFCDHTDSPFIIRTKTAKQIPFDEGITGEGVYEDFFMRLRDNDYEIIVCPDAMFHVYRNRYSDISVWSSFVKKWNIYKFRKSPTIDLEFPCRPDVCLKKTGLALHPCCLQELSDLIKFIFDYCNDTNIFCEPQEGTLLGAVKLGKILPWERDGDLTFLTANYTALQNIKPFAEKAGYRVSDDHGIWCCADNRTAGGKFRINSKHWEVQLYGQHLMDSEMLVLKGKKPTIVNLDGQWLMAPRNPGLHTRNRYGHEIYAHAQHWLTLGEKSGWINYKTGRFSKCPHTGQHDCLDLFNGNGDMQFRLTIS